MADPTPQRAYRAPCPGCGAPVEFKSAQSTHAVCGYCQSTVLRQGEVLQRLGKMAELFDDHSLLQLGASGQIDGAHFTLVGRLLYQYREGRWTEWEAVFDADGQRASLSEDNGAYVFSRPLAVLRELPAPEHLRVGASTAINGQRFSVASNEQVSLVSAQGELPHLPPLGQAFALVELRSEDDPSPGGPALTPRVLSIDYGSAPPAVSLGRAVTLDELQMQGLKSESATQEKGRQFNCPQCAAPIVVQLSQSKCISCSACNSLIDLDGGLGGELRHAEQAEPVRPLIALGSQGQLQGAQWQVVGFVHRMGHAPGETDELYGWSEYLLFNAKRGFCFLVDAQDGWSLVKPTTGAPVLSPSGQSARYLGASYQLKDSYEAQTSYVAGEFYWRVARGQTSFNRDFAKGLDLLSMEQTPQEITWSSGRQITSEVVAKAFKLEHSLAAHADATPFSPAAQLSARTIVIALALIMLAVMLLSRCNQCDPRVENCSSSGHRSSGGSFGGSSSGGGHK